MSLLHGLALPRLPAFGSRHPRLNNNSMLNTFQQSARIARRIARQDFQRHCTNTGSSKHGARRGRPGTLVFLNRTNRDPVSRESLFLFRSDLNSGVQLLKKNCPNFQLYAFLHMQNVHLGSSSRHRDFYDFSFLNRREHYSLP